jgi:hypothetical protein
MGLTVGHVKSCTIADSSNTALVRPSDWNSAHALSMSLSGTDLTGAFSNANGVSFGSSDNSYLTAQHDGIRTPYKVAFNGYRPGVTQNILNFSSTNTSTAPAWAATPVIVQRPTTVTMVAVPMGWSGASSAASRLNGATIFWGLASRTGTTFTTYWSQSVAMAASISAQSQTLSMFNAAATVTWSSVTANMIRDFIVMGTTTGLPMDSGTHALWMRWQMSIGGGGNVRMGNCADVFATAVSAWTIGSAATVASGVQNWMGASSQANRPTTDSGSWGTNIGTGPASRSPFGWAE